MGRELKRVPLDFNWPLNQTWKGYVNPHDTSWQCIDCGGMGYSPQAKYLHDQWYGYVDFDPCSTGSQPFTPDIPEVRAVAVHNVHNSPGFYGTGETAIATEAARLCSHWNRAWMHHLDQDDVRSLASKGRLCELTHRWTGKEWEPLDPPVIPKAEDVNRWSLIGLGHDSINSWICIRDKCARLGYPDTCAICDGNGSLWPSEDDKRRFEEWEDVEPPVGDGFQLWQTTSEGSPVSPVFETLDELCKWCEKNATTFGSETATAQQWKKMLGDGFVFHQEGNMVFI